MPAFISHSHKDEAFYSMLCLALDGAEIPRWDVKSLAAGYSLGDQLRRAIERCEVCIFVATQNSIKSEWCHAELGAFWGAGKRVIIYLVDPLLTEDDMPKQFRGHLFAKDARQLIDSIHAEYKSAKKYYLFLASPMASYENEEEYQASRAEVLKVCNAFREHCGDVYCAVEQCPTMDSFQARDVSVKIDLKNIRNSENFVMLHPKKMSSSTLFEAGFALAIRKYSLYFAAKREDLPYMLQDASNVFPDISLHELPISLNYDSIVNEILVNKRDLFKCEYIT